MITYVVVFILLLLSIRYQLLISAKDTDLKTQNQNITGLSAFLCLVGLIFIGTTLTTLTPEVKLYMIVIGIILLFLGKTGIDVAYKDTDENRADIYNKISLWIIKKYTTLLLIMLKIEI